MIHNIISTFLAVIVNILISNWLGPTDRGLYTLIYTSTFIITELSTFGIHLNFYYDRKIFRKFYKISLYHQVIIIPFLLIIVINLINIFCSGCVLLGVINSFELFLLSFIMSLNNFLRIKYILDGKLKKYFYSEIIKTLVYLFVIFIFNFSGIITLQQIIVTYISLTFFQIICILILDSHKIKFFSYKKLLIFYRNIYKNSLSLFLASFFSYLSKYIIIFILNFIHGVKVVGYYSTLIIFVDGIKIFNGILNNIRIQENYSSLNKNSFRIFYIVLVIISPFLAYVIDLMYHLIFSSAYSIHYLAFLLLTFIMLALPLLSLTTTNLLLNSDQKFKFAINSLLLFVISIFLSIILIYKYIIIGALATYLLLVFIEIIFVKYLIKNNRIRG